MNFHQGYWSGMMDSFRAGANTFAGNINLVDLTVILGCIWIVFLAYAWTHRARQFNNSVRRRQKNKDTRSWWRKTKDFFPRMVRKLKGRMIADIVEDALEDAVTQSVISPRTKKWLTKRLAESLQLNDLLPRKNQKKLKATLEAKYGKRKNQSSGSPPVEVVTG